MEIIVLQGEDKLALEKRLSVFVAEARKRKWGVNRISAGESALDRIVLSNLFTSNNLFIIDDYRSLSKKDVKYLLKKIDDLEGVLVICSSGDSIPTSFLNNFPKIKKIENFNYPKIIFQFLDSIYPKNAKDALELLHQVLDKEPPELVFHLLAVRLRDIYWSKVDPSTLPYSSWQVEKIERQAAKFDLEKVKDFINELAKYDIEAKRSSLGLTFYLDLLITKHIK